jgi:uncharacterized Tic20 family protein
MHYDSTSSRSRLWATLAHAGPLAAVFLSGGLLAFAAPLAVLLVRRNEDSFSAEHARASLNFQLTLVVAALASGVLAFLTLGLAKLVLLPLWAVIAFASVLLMVVGSIRAYRGYPHHYPFSLNIL